MKSALFNFDGKGFLFLSGFYIFWIALILAAEIYLQELLPLSSYVFILSAALLFLYLVMAFAINSPLDEHEKLRAQTESRIAAMESALLKPFHIRDDRKLLRVLLQFAPAYLLYPVSDRITLEWLVYLAFAAGFAVLLLWYIGMRKLLRESSRDLERINTLISALEGAAPPAKDPGAA